MKVRVAAAVLVLFLTACAASRKTATDGSSLDGTWTLSVFQPAQKKPLAEIFGNRTIEITFDKATHTASGTTGCNRFSGSYTADTASLTFGQNRALTKMACPGYNEQPFLTTLDRVNRYRLIEGQLELMQNDEIVLIFAKKM